MIIIDKDEYMHIVNEQKILFAFIPTVAIHIYFENSSPKDKLKIFFNTREEAEAVLRQINERMEHPLMCVHSTNYWNPAHNVPPLTKPLSEILKVVSEPRELNVD